MQQAIKKFEYYTRTGDINIFNVKDRHSFDTGVEIGALLRELEIEQLKTILKTDSERITALQSELDKLKVKRKSKAKVEV